MAQVACPPVRLWDSIRIVVVGGVGEAGLDRVADTSCSVAPAFIPASSGKCLLTIRWGSTHTPLSVRVSHGSHVPKVAQNWFRDGQVTPGRQGESGCLHKP